MRPRLIILSGVGLALVMFASGLIAATAFFTAEPGRQLSLAADATDVWTDKSVKVNTAAQEFERFPARPVRQQLRAKTATGAAPRVTPDVANTAATPPVQASDQPQEDAGAETIAAHVEWCSGRYRSYRADNNSYTSYSGGRRECISPYIGVVDAATEEHNYLETAVHSSAGWIELASSNSRAYVGTDHIEYCFARYRSYRPEDNTYQPYNGGPRRQCH